MGGALSQGAGLISGPEKKYTHTKPEVRCLLMLNRVYYGMNMHITSHETNKTREKKTQTEPLNNTTTGYTLTDRC